MFASMRAQRTSLVPLFKLGDVITKVKQEVDDTLDGCGAVVVPRQHLSEGFTGWGQETVPALFKPLQCSPQINIREENPELFLDDLDHLDQATKDTIQERCKAKLDANKEHALKALAFSQGLFGKVYVQLARTANVTSDSIRVFLKLFSVTDANQRRLVKSKMASIFKPTFRRALLKSSQDSSEGIFGGKSNVFKNMEENKKQSTLLKAVILQTKKPRKAGKPGAKGGKKPAAQGSKAKGKKPRKRPVKKGAKQDSTDSKDKEGDSKTDSKNGPCKLTRDAQTREFEIPSEKLGFSLQSSSHSHPPSLVESCGCGASMDYTVSSIPLGF